MSEIPTVTVLIPARNEEADVERCLRAVLAQDHPHDRMEIILVDGGSTDRTAEIASKVLAEGDVDWKIVENPAGTTPSNLNAGLGVATGEMLCRVDARSIVPPEYVRFCADTLANRPDVSVTGGAQVAVALDDSAMAVGIARALNNRYAMGGSRYRSGAPSGTADTVYLGAFRTSELRDAGGWDEFFETNQDFELNRRMARKGAVWFDASLEVGYVPRRSLGGLWQQYHRFGRWKVRYWRHTGDRPQPRQIGVLAGVGVACVGGLAMVAKDRQHLRAAGRLVGLGAAGLLGIDAIGGSESVPGRARVVAAASVGAVGAAWTSGVVSEIVAGR